MLDRWAKYLELKLSARDMELVEEERNIKTWPYRFTLATLNFLFKLNDSWRIVFLPFVICFWELVTPSAFAQRPELVVQTGHSGNVNSIGFSPDGNYMVSGSDDYTAKLWEVTTGKEIRTFRGHSFPIRSVSFSPDGKYVVTGGLDTTATLWEVSTGDAINTFRHSSWINSVSFSPDGKYVVTGSRDLTARLWEVKTAKEIRAFRGHSAPVLSVSFSPNGKYMVTGSGDSTAKIWEVKTGEEIRTLRGHASSIFSISFSPNGKYILTGSTDSTAKLWKVKTGLAVRTLHGHSHSINAVNFSPDGKYVITGSIDRMAKLWELNTGKEIRALKHPSDFSISSATFSPDGKYVATGSINEIKLWDIKTGKGIRTFSEQAFPLPFSVSFSPDDGYVIARRSNDTAELWEVKTGQKIRTIGSRDSFKLLGLCPNDKSYLVTGKYIGDNTAKLLDITTGEEIYTFRGHTLGITSGSFSPDGKYIVTGSWDATAKLWDTITGKEIHSFRAPSSIHAVSFNTDGNYLIAGSHDGTAKLWEVATGQEIRTILCDSVINFVSFSPDGKYVVTGGEDHTAKLWKVTTGEKVHIFRHVFQIQSIRFSSDGKYVVTTGSLNETKLWDVTSGDEVRRFHGHSSWINTVSFSPDGKYVIVGSSDQTAKLWEVATGKEIRAFHGHTSSIQSVNFSHDGKYVLTWSNDATIKMWEVSSGKELATFISIGVNDWAVTTPDNFYAVSKGAFKGIAFRAENKAFPFEQFDLRLNRPDLVLSRIGRAPQELIDSYHKAHQKRLEKMKFTEDMLNDDFHLPQIAITTEMLPITTQNKVLQFKIKASDSKYLLDRLNVYVNDVPIYGSAGIDLRDRKTHTHQHDIRLELSNGRNKVQVSTLNDKGAESLRETFEVIYDGAATKPDLYLIAVGVSEYADSLFNLKWAAKDANDIAQCFADSGGRFNQIHTFRLLNREATKENILAFKNTLMQSKVNDQVILFVAGHGLLDKNLDYYFATTNINFSNPSAQGLPYEAIEGLLDGIPARQKLLLMDTCHSGEVDKEETVLVEVANTAKSEVKSRSFRNFKPISQTGKLGLSNSFKLMQELFANLSRGSGAVVISAASGVEYAYEDKQWQNGVFTYCVLEGLKTHYADLNTDNKILVSELKDYVTAKVQKLTQGRQTPTSRRENLEFDFLVF